MQLWTGFMLSKDCDNAWLWELTMSFYIFLPTITFWTKLIYFAPLPLWSLWPVSSYGKMKQRGWEFKDWQDTPTMCRFSSSHVSWDVSCHWATSAPCHGEWLWNPTCRIFSTQRAFDWSIVYTPLFFYWTMKSQLLASGHLLAIHKQEKLILFVKQNPPIYDKKDRAYKERGPGRIYT